MTNWQAANTTDILHCCVTPEFVVWLALIGCTAMIIICLILATDKRLPK